jgi:ankyrin repeat protein
MPAVYPEVIKFLNSLEKDIKKGQVPDLNTCTKFTYLDEGIPHWAVHYGCSIGLFKYLLENVPVPVHLMNLACTKGRTEIVKLLIQNKIPICLDGDIPIHCAARNGHVAIVKMLLENGYSANATNGLLQTPLQLAVNYRHSQVIKLLLDNGADKYLTDRYGHSAAWLATNKKVSL